MRNLGILIAIVVVTCVAAPASNAGLFSNLFDAMNKAVQDYNNGRAAEGKAIHEKFKAGDFKGAPQAWMDATNQTNIQAHANGNAILKALLDFVYFIPNLIKKVFEAFVDFFKNLWDALTGGGGGDGGAKAPGSSFAPKESNTEGEDFFASFEAEPDLTKRLSVYVEYARKYRELKGTTDGYLLKNIQTIVADEGGRVKAVDVAKGKQEVKEKTAMLAGALERMEASLARDIAASDDAMKVYDTFRKSLDATARFTIMPSLNLKVLELRK